MHSQIVLTFALERIILKNIYVEVNQTTFVVLLSTQFAERVFTHKVVHLKKNSTRILIFLFYFELSGCLKYVFTSPDIIEN